MNVITCLRTKSWFDTSQRPWRVFQFKYNSENDLHSDVTLCFAREASRRFRRLADCFMRSSQSLDSSSIFCLMSGAAKCLAAIRALPEFSTRSITGWCPCSSMSSFYHTHTHTHIHTHTPNKYVSKWFAMKFGVYRWQANKSRLRDSKKWLQILILAIMRKVFRKFSDRLISAKFLCRKITWEMSCQCHVTDLQDIEVKLKILWIIPHFCLL